MAHAHMWCTFLLSKNVKNKKQYIFCFKSLIVVHNSESWKPACFSNDLINQITTVLEKQSNCKLCGKRRHLDILSMVSRQKNNEDFLKTLWLPRAKEMSFFKKLGICLSSAYNYQDVSVLWKTVSVPTVRKLRLHGSFLTSMKGRVVPDLHTLVMSPETSIPKDLKLP